VSANDSAVSPSHVDATKRKSDRAPASFWFLLVVNVLGASIANYGAWLLDSSVSRFGDSGPGGGLVMLFFISLPLLVCGAADLIALVVTIVVTIKRPRLAPATRFFAIVLPWLIAFAVGPLSH